MPGGEFNVANKCKARVQRAEIETAKRRFQAFSIFSSIAFVSMRSGVSNPSSNLL